MDNEKALNAYWNFAYERQNIFHIRINGASQPYTSDKILQNYSFTNAYRASDRVSQYLIKNVIYKGIQTVEEVFFRTLLFKIFNSIKTWESLVEFLGEVSYSNYSEELYSKALEKAWILNGTLYSSAYIMPSGKTSFGMNKKYQNNLLLLSMMMKESYPRKVEKSKSLEDVYRLLLACPTIGKFLAFQYTIDLNYSEIVNFNEADFVVAGPGALSGIRKCFGKVSTKPENIIFDLYDNQESEFEKRGLEFKSLWGRELKPIDLQNLFCETDKYCRVAHPEVIGIANRQRIKRKFNSNKKIPEPWYPPKWGINDKIKLSLSS